MRLIDADELIVLEMAGIKFVPQDFIEDAPTIDPIRHALWVSDRSLGGHCSNCGMECGSIEFSDDYVVRPTWKYCPNCGARMDGGIEK